MNSKQAEIWLAVLYIGSMIFSVTSVISLVTTWQNWVVTLDGCIDVDCGCILYGINTFRTFLGGDEKLCHFAAYALTPIIIISLCLGAYHGYRCCIHKNLNEPKQINGGQIRNHNGYVVVHIKKRVTFKRWMPIGFLAALVCCLSLAHAVVITDGYYKTCEQYRRNLIQLLGSRGREILDEREKRKREKQDSQAWRRAGKVAVQNRTEGIHSRTLPLEAETQRSTHKSGNERKC
ncbi:hypothetical protein ALC60_10855 [Trachymyrmex zeteki]|uniref:Uncharacterized protein n=1 Tax=Mycetomoellerius zeteki TaxID=64791 RepID=A0A151WQE6_9HYME|nr:hypothetical protein ALC60_10855 [Trachymyrmex zeteki]